MASTITHFEDAIELLQFDPSQVVADRRPQPLDPLQSFASTLKHYVELSKAIPCLKSTNSANPPTPPAAATRKNSSSLLEFDLGAVVLRQVGNAAMLSKLEEFASRLEHSIHSSERPEQVQSVAAPQPEAVPSAASPPAATNRPAKKKKRKSRRSEQPDTVPSAPPVTPPANSNSRNIDTNQSPHQEPVLPDAAPTSNAPPAAVSPTNTTGGASTEEDPTGGTEPETTTTQEATPDAVQSRTALPAENSPRRADRVPKEEDPAEDSIPTAQVAQDSTPDAVHGQATLLPAENPTPMEEDPAEGPEPETPTAQGNHDSTPDVVQSDAVLPAENPPRRSGARVLNTLQESALNVTPNSKPDQVEQPNEAEPPKEPEEDTSEAAAWPGSQTDHEANSGGVPEPQSERATSEDESSFCTAVEAATEEELTNNPRRVSQDFEVDPLQGLYPRDDSFAEPESPLVASPTPNDGKDFAAQGMPKDLSDDDSSDDEDESIPISQLKGKMATKNNPQLHATTNKKLAASSSRRTWVECDRCSKWRRLSGYVDENKLPTEWYCEMNEGDPERAHCSAPEEQEERDEFRLKEPQPHSAVVNRVQHPQQTGLQEPQQQVQHPQQVGRSEAPQQAAVVIQVQPQQQAGLKEPLQQPAAVNQVQHPQQVGLSEPQQQSVVANQVQHLQHSVPREPGQSVVVNQVQHWQQQAERCGQPQSIANRGQQLCGIQVQHQQQTGLYGQLQSIANRSQQFFGGTSSSFAEPPRTNVVQGFLQRITPTQFHPHPVMLLAQGALNRSRETNQFLKEALGDGDPVQNHGRNAGNREGGTLLGNTANPVASTANAATESSAKAVKRVSLVASDQPRKKRRRKTKKEKLKEEEDLPDLPEAPKVEAPEGYRGTLTESKLQRSVGLTRKVLNNHLSELGLSAQFNVSVFSTKDRKLSHMTFNSKWNQLPYTVDQTFKFWLGEGPNRLTSALHVHPDKNPNENGYPLFWSEKSKSRTLCYYVGHFQCIKFDTTQKVKFKEERRQALLEFKLVEFKEEIREKMLKIEQEQDSSARREGQHQHQAVNSEVEQQILHQQEIPLWSIMC